MNALTATLSTLPLAQLRLSPLNVRLHRSDTDIAALAASITTFGVLSSLGVHPNSENADEFMVFMGGNRLAALELLAKGGTDIGPVPVQIFTEAEARAMSLAENFTRADMSAADEVLAFKALVEEGQSIDEIAFRYATAPWRVEQRLRLANLAPVVFEQLASGGINLEQAQAFAATPDQARQTEVFEQLFNDRVGDWMREPRNIRSNILEGAVRGNSSVAIFVGGDAFREAGGIIEGDLFEGTGETAYWRPSELLNDLAEAKIIAEADRLKEEMSLPFVEPLLTDYVPYGGTEARRVSDEEEIETLTQAGKIGRILILSREGVPTLDRSLYTYERTKAQAAAGSAPEKTGPTNEVGDKAMSQFAQQRRDVLRLALIRNPELATAYGMFAIVDRMVVGSRYQSGAASFFDVNSIENPAGNDSDAWWFSSPMMKAIDAAHRALPTEWTKVGKKGSDGCFDRFTAWLELPIEKRHDWFAWATAMSLEGSAHGYGLRSKPFHDALGRSLDIEVRADWTPTVENTFTHFRKGQIIALLEKAGDEDLAKRAAKMKGDEIKSLAGNLASAKGIKAHPEASAYMQAWVPSAMTFGEAPRVTKRAPRKAKAKAEAPAEA